MKPKGFDQREGDLVSYTDPPIDLQTRTAEDEAGSFMRRMIQIGRLIGDSYTIRGGL
jgi:hypothetical protein